MALSQFVKIKLSSYVASYRICVEQSTICDKLAILKYKATQLLV